MPKEGMKSETPESAQSFLCSMCTSSSWRIRWRAWYLEEFSRYTSLQKNLMYLFTTFPSPPSWGQELPHPSKEHQSSIFPQEAAMMLPPSPKSCQWWFFPGPQSFPSNLGSAPNLSLYHIINPLIVRILVCKYMSRCLKLIQCLFTHRAFSVLPLSTTDNSDFLNMARAEG